MYCEIFNVGLDCTSVGAYNPQVPLALGSIFDNNGILLMCGHGEAIFDVSLYAHNPVILEFVAKTCLF